MVGQNFRFMRDTQILKRAVDQGELGEIYHARAVYLRQSGIPRIGSWFTQKRRSGGGSLIDIGVHVLDAALYLMGNFSPVAVSGITYMNFGHRGLGNGSWGMSEIAPGKPFDVDDHAMALVRLKGGACVEVEVSWAAGMEQGSQSGIQLFGTKGGGTILPLAVTKLKGKRFETTVPDVKRLPLPEDRMVHFVDCILDGKKPICDPKESLAVQQILDGIYESSRKGREVRIKAV
jgi:predicted dehydrogenase